MIKLDGKKYLKRVTTRLYTDQQIRCEAIETLDSNVQITNVQWENSNDKFILTADFNLEQSMNIKTFLAKYSNKKLVDISTFDINSAGNTPVELRLSRIETNETAKLFVWDENINAIIISKTLE